MNEALERAINAFNNQMASDDNKPEDIAHAVLLSIREPTPAMRAAGERILDLAIFHGNTIKCWELAEQTFQAMVEELLK